MYDPTLNVATVAQRYDPVSSTVIVDSMGSTPSSLTLCQVGGASQAPTWPNDPEASGKADVIEVTWSPSADVVFKS
ncbi:hypothetical protein GW17_00000813 [Ensete ventricosum]|nr:hypothetical protein GW17_00000813 [Ensete ventricosum]RZS09859.1 hypothetical protein BHM03_00040984 [Ensete ventricosum]